MWFPPPSINFHTLSAIKKERDKVEKKLAIATKDYTNAVNKNRGKFFSKRDSWQNDIDEKKAVMDLWKSKLNTAVSENSDVSVFQNFVLFRIEHLIQKWKVIPMQ